MADTFQMTSLNTFSYFLNENVDIISGVGTRALIQYKDIILPV